MLGIATAHSAMALTMRRDVLATRRYVFCSVTRMAAAPHRLQDRDNCDDDRKEPTILRATATLMDFSSRSATTRLRGSSAGSGDGVDQ
jgi:hypothetical protein